MTAAQRIALKINRYEATHSPLHRDVWNDVIRRLPEYDDEAASEADPNHEPNVAVLTDGTRIEHRDGEWVVA